MKRNTKKFLLDIAMTVAFLALLEPELTGMGIHEWGGLAIGLFFMVHLLFNRKWIASVTNGFFRNLPGRTRLNYLLNLCLLAGFSTIIISGTAIAKTIDFSWLPLRDAISWKALHTSAAMMILLATGGHLGLHWNWILERMTKKKELVNA